MLLLVQIIAKHESIRHQMITQRILEFVYDKAINHNYTS